MALAAGLILCTLAAAYAAAVAATATGLRRILDAPARAGDLPAISVVVAARNEETAIEECLEAILSNDYPPERFQLIVVDDGSDDATHEILSGIARERGGRKPELLVLRTSGRGAGKGGALESGILAATGDIVVTTDADCSVSNGWLRALAGSFTDDTGFVAGPVVNRDGGGLWRRIEALEFLALVGFGAGSIGLGSPTICNSANAAYPRRLFLEWRDHGHPGHLPASDELVMHYVHTQTPYGVAFTARHEAVVETAGASSVAHFWRQRSRWASSIPHFPPGVRRLSAIFYAFFAALVAALVASLFEPWLLVPAAVALGVKAVSDAAIVVPLCRHVGREHLLRVFPATEMLHVPYILVAALIGMFRPTRWKGRRVNARAAPTPGVAESRAA